MAAWLRGLRRVQKNVVNRKPSNRRRLSVETLEDRRLLAASITEFPVPTTVAGQAVGITNGPNGALWFTEQAATQDQIGQVTTSGTFQLFNLSGGGSLPGDIVTGYDGALWFVQTAGAEVGRTDTGGNTQEFSFGKGSAPHSLTSGPGQALSIADAGLRQIREIGTNGAVLLAANLPSGFPEGITIGPDGNVWFTNPADNAIETLPAGTFSAAPPFKEFPIPTPNSMPERITVGRDGNLWFTEQGANKIGRISIAGNITEFALPTPNSGPFEITRGPDGALWFTEQNANQVGRITTAGQILEFVIPTPRSQPAAITAGPDGNIWFAEQAANKIAKFDLRSIILVGKGVQVCSFAGTPVTNVPVATFMDTRPPDMIVTYSATIDWGDGTPPTTGTVSSIGAGPQFMVSGSHTYSIEGNLTTTITVTRSDGVSTTINGVAMVGGYITSLYQALLQRVPDPQGLNGWVSFLNSGASRQVIAEDFWNSPEHRILEVTQFYQSLLHRAPDPNGLAAWVSALLNGASESELAIAFLISPEYTSAHPTAVAYVTGLYNDILQRPPDATGLAHWTPLAQTGFFGREVVAFDFLTSDEAYVGAIDSYYKEFLGRSPSSQEEQSYLALLVGGTTPADITAVFLSSPEYVNRQIALACAG